MVKRRRSAGFTLVESMIVLALVAIILTILFPILTSARVQATERMAQAYSSSVSKALTAVLASDSTLTPAAVAAGTFECGAGAAETTLVVVNGTSYDYGWNAAPTAVQSCIVAENPSTKLLNVRITTARATYVNGVLE